MSRLLYISFIFDKSLSYYESGRLVKDVINEKDWILQSVGILKNKLLSIDVIQYDKNIDISNFIDYDIIILGGSELKISSDDISWINKVVNQIKKLEKEDLEIIGICFGHQLLAYAYGCEIKKFENLKFGIKKLYLTKNGLNSKILENCQSSFHSYISHHDYVEKTSADITTTVLDSNSICYGFDIGSNIHGFQFHPEIPKSVMFSLLDSKINYINPNDILKIRNELNLLNSDISLNTLLRTLNKTTVANKSYM